jgi:hypothetical protein
LIYCDKRDVESPGTPPPAQPLPPGISQNLTRSDKPLTYFFDYFGPVQGPAAQKSVQVAGIAANAITGWAIDDSAKKLAGGVDVVIDQAPYSAHYGTVRTDVAAHFKNPDYTNSGFDLTLAPGQLPKGSHSVSIRVIASDKKSYYQGPPIQFSVN